MTKVILVLGLLCIFSQLNAQESYSAATPSVEKSIFSIQGGYFGGWINNEFKISNQFSLRTELGIDFTRKFSVEPTWTELDHQTSINIEPKWYFNLKKRFDKGRDIRNNAGAYLSLRVNIPTYSSTSSSWISLAPTIGLRRNIGAHFHIEGSAGFSMYHYNDVFLVEGVPSFRLGYTL